MATTAAKRSARVLAALVAIIAVLIALPDDSKAGDFVATVVPVFVYLAAARLGSESSHLRRLGAVLTATVVGTAIAIALTDGAGETRVAAAGAVAALLVALTIRLVGTAALRRGRINAQTVLAALSVYLLAGLFFAYVFQVVDAVGDPGFSVPDGTGRSISTWVYTSFVTQTTLGYGDVVPVTDVARAAAILQAVLGQLYVITVVGYVVGNLSRAPTPGNEEGAGRDDAGP